MGRTLIWHQDGETPEQAKADAVKEATAAGFRDVKATDATEDGRVDGAIHRYRVTLKVASQSAESRRRPSLFGRD